MGSSPGACRVRSAGAARAPLSCPRSSAPLKGASQLRAAAALPSTVQVPGLAAAVRSRQVSGNAAYLTCVRQFQFFSCTGHQNRPRCVPLTWPGVGRVLPAPPRGGRRPGPRVTSRAGRSPPTLWAARLQAVWRRFSPRRRAGDASATLTRGRPACGTPEQTSPDGVSSRAQPPFWDRFHTPFARPRFSARQTASRAQVSGSTPN